MKKFLCAAMAVAMMAAGCTSGKKSKSNGKSEDLNYIFMSDLKTIDYTISQNTSDSSINANLVDGLTEVDPDNNYVGALAESFEHNDDASEWTFHIRQNAPWVTNAGEEYDDIKAQDFVTGLRHAADFKAGLLSLATDHVKGLADYVNGTASWDTVGIKATDDRTLVFTLTQPTPYFASLVTANVFLPINQEFLEAQGSGCKLGAPDPNTCSFGKPTEPSSILYNGGYILTSFVSKSEEKLTKNQSYWDADNIHIEKANYGYDDGSDPESTVKGFEQSENPYYVAVLLTNGANFQQYLDKYQEYAFNGIQSASTFGVNFNLNRITYNTTSKNTAQQADTREALLNANFRRAMKYGFDRTAYVSAIMDSSIATKAIRNIECPWDFVKSSSGSYGQLVQNASEDSSTSLAEGVDAYYKPDQAKQYLSQAKSELNVSWPIHLDMMCNEGDSASIAQASSLKQSLEASLGSDNVVVDIHPVNDDVFSNSAYTSTGPVDADWDINTSTGWSYDYVDPKSYLHIFTPRDGDTIRQSMGVEFEADGDAQNTAAIEKSGLAEYQDLYDKANAINSDLDARYQAFAECEAYLLDNALFIPVSTATASVNWRISRSVPFSGGYRSNKLKGVIIQKDPITAQQYYDALKDWQDRQNNQSANA